jgi:hypothetical protein
VSGKESLNARKDCHERAGKVRKGRRADDHQQSDTVPHDGIAFIRFVAMRRSWVSAIQPRFPAASSHVSSGVSGVK